MAYVSRGSGREMAEKVTAAERTRQAITAINSGDIAGGRQLLAEALSTDADYELAWLWFAAVADRDEEKKFWADHKGAGVNSIRTQTFIQEADVVVVRFGDKYRQWNAAFDAGFASALGKPVITQHDEEFDHALKEVDAAARATARTPEQVAAVLRYVITAELA